MTSAEHTTTPSQSNGSDRTNGINIYQANPRAWKRRAQDGEWYTLPAAGQPAKLRRPSLTALAAKIGHIPNRLASEVVTLLSELDMRSYRDRKPEEQHKAFVENARAFVLIARECFVEPRLNTDLRCQTCQHINKYESRQCVNCSGMEMLLVEPNYDAGEISPLDIPDFDYSWLAFSFVEGSDDRVAPFRLIERLGEAAPRS